MKVLFLTAKKSLTILMSLLFATMLITAGQSDAASPPDREDDVSPVRLDVYVLVGTTLQNPIGLCTADPCAPGETSPNEAMFTLSGSPLGVTWGEFQMTAADSRVSCRKDGTTNIRINLTGLIPNSVYSIFYRTFGPDSSNPFCPNEERSVVVPNLCKGKQCQNVQPDSKILSDANGTATFVGRVNGCLLDATITLLDVIYHSDGNTYFELPNFLEFQTQLTPCQGNLDCQSGDYCLNNVCQPLSCPAEPTCRVCSSSFGRDAHRQAVIVQKAP
jgi:hypothetical protein